MKKNKETADGGNSRKYKRDRRTSEGQTASVRLGDESEWETKGDMEISGLVTARE